LSQYSEGGNLAKGLAKGKEKDRKEEGKGKRDKRGL
jgi:hypothetical protein